MPAKPTLTKAGFIKSYLLPVFITFLIPGFSLWFFDHVERYLDNHIRQSIVTQLRSQSSLTAEQRDRMIEFYSKVKVSRILASNNPEMKPLQTPFKSVQTRFAVFRWMKRIATVCLVAALAAFVLVGIGVVFSFSSQNALYWSLRLGWSILRVFALIEVVGQGILAVALSFWVTAFWMEKYFIKLILVAGLLAFCGVALLIVAIFRKLNIESRFQGRLLNKESAPELWQRVCQMAGKMGIAPPDNIFVGIDDNFFVTEHPVKVGEQAFTGRTLFVSISLLKTLTRNEADAVLAHELAHFSGADTIYSKKISPLLGKYMHYLEALYQGGISRPIFHFMFFFWNLYQLSLNRLRRQREFRADRLGSEQTSAADMAQALVKIAAYCRYREKVQTNLFEKEENVETMDIFKRIENGFPDYMRSGVNSTELGESDTPHPFDSHPPLTQRLRNLSLEPQSVLKSESTLPVLENTWFSAIDGAAGIEAEEWKSFEDSFHKAHQETLAWRFKPEGAEEIAHIIKYFPEVSFNSPKATAVIDYEKVRVSDWEEPVWFSTIISCKLDESLGHHRLVIEYQVAGQKKQSCKISYKEFTSYKGFKAGASSFLETFKKYYARHMHAKQYHAKKAGRPALAAA